jgi:hypothetical protein
MGIFYFSDSSLPYCFSPSSSVSKRTWLDLGAHAVGECWLFIIFIVGGFLSLGVAFVGGRPFISRVFTWIETIFMLNKIIWNCEVII